MFSTFDFAVFLKITLQGFAFGLILCVALKEIFGFRFKQGKDE